MRWGPQTQQADLVEAGDGEATRNCHARCGDLAGREKPNVGGRNPTWLQPTMYWEAQPESGRGGVQARIRGCLWGRGSGERCDSVHTFRRPRWLQCVEEIGRRPKERDPLFGSRYRHCDR